MGVGSLAPNPGFHPFAPFKTVTLLYLGIVTVKARRSSNWWRKPSRETGEPKHILWFNVSPALGEVYRARANRVWANVVMGRVGSYPDFEVEKTGG